jgi:hypothetical protein
MEKSDTDDLLDKARQITTRYLLETGTTIEDLFNWYNAQEDDWDPFETPLRTQENIPYPVSPRHMKQQVRI